MLENRMLGLCVGGGSNEINLYKKKCSAISYIRLIAMIMIVACHFFQYYDNELAWWFNVGVEIFFIISGFLYGTKEIENPIEFVIKQFKKILIPYYTFLVFISVIYFIFAKESITIISIAKSVLCIGEIKGLEHLWFVGFILFCYLITPYLFWIKKKTENYSLIKMSITFFLVLVFVMLFIHSYFDSRRISCYLVGYFISIYYEKYGIKAMRIMVLLFSVIAIPINIIRIYLKYFYKISSNSIFEKLFRFSEGYMHLALAGMIFLVLFLLFRNVNSCRVTEISDKFSYYIYIVHQLFILSPFSLMEITSFNIFNWIVVCISIIITADILYIASQGIVKMTRRS